MRVWVMESRGELPDGQVRLVGRRDDHKMFQAIGPERESLRLFFDSYLDDRCECRDQHHSCEFHQEGFAEELERNKTHAENVKP